MLVPGAHEARHRGPAEQPAAQSDVDEIDEILERLHYDVGVLQRQVMGLNEVVLHQAEALLHVRGGE